MHKGWWTATESYDYDKASGLAGCVIGMLTTWPSSLMIRKRTGIGITCKFGGWCGARKRPTDCERFAFGSSDTGKIYRSGIYRG